MSALLFSPNLSRLDLILCLDAGNNKSYSTNRFQSYGTGLTTENVTFAINGTGTFKRVAAGTVIGGYRVKYGDVVYSYDLGTNGCHYHGNSAPAVPGTYATFSFDYLVTGATNYPSIDYLANFEGVANGSIGIANTLQNVWQRRSFTSTQVNTAGNINMYLYPGACSSGRLADSGTIYYKNPKVEFINFDTGPDGYSSSPNISTWFDLTKNKLNGTLTNNPTSSFANRGSLLFDGTDDYINIPHSASLNFNKLTFLSFIKTPAIYTSGYRAIISKQGADRDFNFYLFSSSSNGVIDKFHFSSARVTGYDPLASMPGGSLALNAWHQVGFSIGSGKLNYILNGNIIYSTSYAGTFNANNTYPLTIGSADNYFLGNIASAVLYNRVISNAEINQHYQDFKTRY